MPQKEKKKQQHSVIHTGAEELRGKQTDAQRAVEERMLRGQDETDFLVRSAQMDLTTEEMSLLERRFTDVNVSLDRSRIAITEQELKPAEAESWERSLSFSERKRWQRINKNAGMMSEDLARMRAGNNSGFVEESILKDERFQKKVLNKKVSVEEDGKPLTQAKLMLNVTNGDFEQAQYLDPVLQNICAKRYISGLAVDVPQGKTLTPQSFVDAIVKAGGVKHLTNPLLRAAVRVGMNSKNGTMPGVFDGKDSAFFREVEELCNQRIMSAAMYEVSTDATPEEAEEKKNTQVMSAKTLLSGHLYRIQQDMGVDERVQLLGQLEEKMRALQQSTEEDDKVALINLCDQLCGNLTDMAQVRRLLGDGEDIRRLTKEVEKHSRGKKMLEKTESKKQHEKTRKTESKLIESKKLTFGVSGEDSQEMKELKSALKDLRGELTAEIPQKDEDFDAAIDRMEEHYRKAIKACKTYIAGIEAKGGGRKTISGRERLNAAKKLLEDYEKELELLRPNAEGFRDEREEGMPWTDVLWRVRAEQLSAEDKNVKMIGAGASVLYRRTVRGKTEFIKAEERLINGVENSAAAWEACQLTVPGTEEFLKRLEDHLNGDQKAIRFIKEILTNDTPGNNDIFYRGFQIRQLGMEKDAGKLEKNPEALRRFLRESELELGRLTGSVMGFILRDEENMKTFFRMMSFFVKKANEYENATGLGVIAPDSIISNRNVSTSIMAKALGVSGLVAESKTILINRRDGEAIRANSMQDAGGQSFDSLEEEAQKQGARIEYTPEALIQLNTMRVFDMICGQVDRHKGNYHVQTLKRNGVFRVTSVTGIDNDLSFGNITAEQLMNRGFISRMKTFSAKGEPVTHLPADFVERILNLTPEAAEMSQLALRSDDEIKALKERLEYVKKELRERTAKPDDDPAKIVLVDTKKPQEMEQMKQSMRARAREKEVMLHAEDNTYVSWQYLADGGEGANAGETP